MDLQLPNSDKNYTPNPTFARLSSELASATDSEVCSLLNQLELQLASVIEGTSETLEHWLPVLSRCDYLLASKLPNFASCCAHSSQPEHASKEDRELVVCILSFLKNVFVSTRNKSFFLSIQVFDS
jgi:hypothetical protein